MKKRYFIFSLFLCILIVSFKPTYAYFNDVKSVQSKSIQSKVMDSSGLSLTTQQNNYVYFKKAEAGIKSITYTITNTTSLELKPKLTLTMDNNDDFQVGFNSDATGNELVVNNLNSKQTKAITFYIKKKRSAGEDVNQKRVTLTLSAESIGGKKLDSITQIIDVGPDLNVTGDQEINFSTTNKDSLSTTWTIKGASTNHSVTVGEIATVENALSPLNSVTKQTADTNGYMQKKDWQQYFKVTAFGVTDNQFTITVDRTSKALSYKKLKVWITVTGTNPDGTTASYTKSVNITPILDSTGNRTVAWPVTTTYPYKTRLFYGSDGHGYAKTVFPLIVFSEDETRLTNRICNLDGDWDVIKYKQNVYVPNRGYYAAYKMEYNGLYNFFGAYERAYEKRLYVDTSTNPLKYKYVDKSIELRDKYYNYIYYRYFTVKDTVEIDPDNDPMNFINPDDYVYKDDKTLKSTETGRVVYSVSDANKEYYDTDYILGNLSHTYSLQQ